MKMLIGRLKWQSEKVLFGKRAFLFCFGEKCMSGRVIDLQEVVSPDQYQITVDFIVPEYFEGDFVIGNVFTIREASKVLGEGKVLFCLNKTP